MNKAITLSIAALCCGLTGCASPSECVRPRSGHDTRSAAARANHDRCGAAEQVHQAELRGAQDELRSQRQANDALAATLLQKQQQADTANRKQKVAQARQGARLKVQRVRLALLEALLRKHARVVHRLTTQDIRAGRIAGLGPTRPLIGKLVKHLSPVAGNVNMLELNPDARVLWGRHDVQRLSVLRREGAVEQVEFNMRGKGHKEVEAIKKLMAEACRDSNDGADWMGRQGPGTPQPGGLPLVVLMRASCALQSGPWSLEVNGSWRHDNAELNNIDLTLSFDVKS